MPPKLTPTPITPIIESILADSAGRHMRFRWHAEPCPADNTQVAIFEYLADGKYIQSDYVGRHWARKRWRKLISEGWYVLRQAQEA